MFPLAHPYPERNPSPPSGSISGRESAHRLNFSYGVATLVPRERSSAPRPRWRVSGPKLTGCALLRRNNRSKTPVQRVTPSQSHPPLA